VDHVKNFVQQNCADTVFVPFLFHGVDPDSFAAFHEAFMSLITLLEVMTSFSDDERVRMNRAFSLACLAGEISIEQPGISSPHLKAQFYSNVRRHGTGFLREESGVAGP
jgi:hypothetical protein